MASPPFEMDDLTDEDFFDRLVNDDNDGINCTGSGPSPVKADDSGKAKAFSDLSISEVGPTRLDSIGNFSFSVEESEADEGVLLAGSKASEGAVVVTESNAVLPNSVNESGEARLGEEGALYDSARDDSSVGTGTGTKEVHWSSFNSDLIVYGGSGLRSYSDFFNEFGDGSFVNLGNKSSSPSEFSSNIGVSENSVADMGSSSNQDAQNYGQTLKHNADPRELNSSWYWEHLYPGWRYDPNTGLWHQLDEHDADLTATRNDNVVQSVDVNAQSVSLRAKLRYLSSATNNSIRIHFGKCGLGNCRC